MSATVRTTIRGADYALVKLDPLRGGRLAARVGQLLAAAFADQGAVSTLSDLLKNGADGALDQPQLLAALAGGVRHLDADALYGIALEFTRGQVFAGQKKLHDDHAFNAHFAEHEDHLLLVLAWALRENCAGFFGLAGRA